MTAQGEAPGRSNGAGIRGVGMQPACTGSDARPLCFFLAKILPPEASTGRARVLGGGQSDLAISSFMISLVPP